MIDDSNEITRVADRIVSRKLNAEFVLAQRLLELRGGFESLSDGLFRARAMDIQDVFHRILANLLEIDHVRTNALMKVPPGTILVSESLLPSDIIHLNTANIAAIVTEAGSPVSHAAILCRGLKIPYVAGIKGIAILMRNTVLVGE
jgi:phosphoenolpyruvate-protein kinase (PTS system EI component)